MAIKKISEVELRLRIRQMAIDKIRELKNSEFDDIELTVDENGNTADIWGVLDNEIEVIIEDVNGALF